MYWFIWAHSLIYFFNCCVISFDSKVNRSYIASTCFLPTQRSLKKKTNAEHRKCWAKQRNPSLAANPKLRRFEWHVPWPSVGFCGLGEGFVEGPTRFVLAPKQSLEEDSAGIR